MEWLHEFMNLGKKIKRLGPNQQKIILLIFAGVGLSLARSPNKYFKIIRETKKEWSKVNKQSLERAIMALYRSKLIREQENSDGSLTMVLTDKGKEKVVTFNIDNMEIKKPRAWDKKWRMVLFDVPEKHKPAREGLREILKRLGFHEYQKSVFVHPYPCQSEMDYIIEYFNIRPHVRMITTSILDNEIHLRKIFGLV